MKICIIANGFSGTTIPLASHLSREGHSVDIHYLLFEGTCILDTLGLDRKVRISMKPDTLKTTNTIYRYLPKDVKINIQWVIQERTKLAMTPLGNVQRWLNKVILKRYCRKYIAKKYDITNVVVYPRFALEVCKELKKSGSKFFLTFHEVLQNLVTDRTIIPYIDQAVSLGSCFVTHSKNTFDNLMNTSQYKGISDRGYIIPFGPFEGYLAYGEGKKCISCKDYILYLGNILPYKGLKYLYDAICELDDLGNVKVVVAGNGKDDVLNKMKNDNRFIILNRYISNTELVYLVRNCRVLVCPYLAASQSGIVQTAMVFKKPIIATNVGAFSETVIDGENGYLVKPQSPAEIASAIRKIYNEELMPAKYSIPKDYSWNHIIPQYDILFNRLMSDTKI